MKIIKKNWQFEALISPNSNQIVTNELVVYYQIFDFFEVGISIPKKFANAVKRNYYKRQIKTILQESIKTKKFPNLRVVFISRRPFLNLSFSKKRLKLNQVLEQLQKNEN